MTDINVAIEQSAINVEMTGGGSNPFVNADVPFRFNGAAGDTFFIYVSATSTLELWVNGVKQAGWN